MTDREREVSATVTRSAALRARLTALCTLVHETVRTSHEVCDMAGRAQERARRTRSRER